MSEEIGWGGNVAVHSFSKAMSAICVSLDGPFKSGAATPFQRLLADTLIFIQAVVAHELHTSDEPVGLDLLKGLADLPGDQQLTVCTVNHDRLVERFFEREGIVFADGFPQDAINGIRYFDRSHFQRPDARAKLLKLHGSINWWRFDAGGGGFTESRIGIRTLLLDKCRSIEGRRLWNTDPVPHFLTGSYNKIGAYQSGIYLAQMREFDRALDDHDLIVMSGYGWGDEGINKRLKYWVSESDGRQILVLHRNRKHLRQLKSLLHSFDRMRKSRKLISIRKWLCEVDVERFCHMLRKRAGPLSERSFT